jgi:hypothetical protein
LQKEQRRLERPESSVGAGESFDRVISSVMSKEGGRSESTQNGNPSEFGILWSLCRR